jgi:hypothetical protein
MKGKGRQTWKCIEEKITQRQNAYAVHANESLENYTYGMQQAPMIVERSTTMQSSSTAPRRFNSIQRSSSPPEEPKGRRSRMSQFFSS